MMKNNNQMVKHSKTLRSNSVRHLLARPKSTFDFACATKNAGRSMMRVKSITHSQYD